MFCTLIRNMRSSHTPVAVLYAIFDYLSGRCRFRGMFAQAELLWFHIWTYLRLTLNRHYTVPRACHGAAVLSVRRLDNRQSTDDLLPCLGQGLVHRLVLAISKGFACSSSGDRATWIWLDGLCSSASTIQEAERAVWIRYSSPQTSSL